MGLYATDGSINVTVVDGLSYTGLYAANGSYNVVLQNGSVYTGLMNPCGAYNVIVSTSDTNRMAPSGAFNVSTTPYVDGTMKVTVVAGSLSAMPTPSNNIYSTFGDSRVQSSVGAPPASRLLPAPGFASWAQNKAGGRCWHDAVGGFGVGGDTTTDMVLRLPDVVANPAGTVVFLGGVNDTSGTAWLANYTEIFDTLSDAGKVIIVCNELPSNEYEDGQPSEAAQVQHLARHAWLSDPARRVTWPNLVQINTFDPCLEPNTNITFKAGYAPDGLHPMVLGNSVIGGVIGDAFNELYADYALQNTLPSSAADAYHVTTNPWGCILPNFLLTGSVTATAGVTGFMPTGWLYNVASAGGATITASKGVDDDGFDCQIIHVTGTPTAGSKSLTFQCASNVAGVMNSVSPGEWLRTVGRVVVDAGGTGFRGFGVGATIVGNDGTVKSNSSFNLTGTANGFLGQAFDDVVVSQRAEVHASWASMTSRSLTKSFAITYDGGVPVDFTVRISRAGLFRNQH